ncbi:MAG: hypothetical protein HGA76_04645 [Candidatus Firestonebacteria bacterium]|nr:hypothetical protein [Candidatus Firestonebacteria bacterium]
MVNGDILINKYGESLFLPLQKLAQTGTMSQRETANTILANWTVATLNDGDREMIVVSGKEPLNAKLCLNPVELKSVEDMFMTNTIKENNNVLLYFSNYGLHELLKKEKDFSRKQILKAALKHCLMNNTGYLRKQVVDYLGESGNAEDISELERLARNDTYIDPASVYFQKRANNFDMKKTKNSYPVREAASAAIEKIKARYKDVK